MSGDYAFRVRGRLSPDIIAALHPLCQTECTTETVLRGPITDQAALHGLIARLEQLGVELVGLLRLPEDGNPSSTRPAAEPHPAAVHSLPAEFDVEGSAEPLRCAPPSRRQS
jgi:hypothetical protein